ncbi:C-C motif chemokine 20-like [Entelurus aequoreus]|uniref:C-C motif chemokine 20-like n=1 Tax=Entelurus aequoreus TaxID=161455 RepID=UPI002B1CF0DC|nr:C-C motif chemokine 20-like [Entelurus aequoreus]
MEGRSTALTALLVLIICTGSTQSASCCVKNMVLRGKLSCQRLLGYSFQTINNSCDIKSVIFHLPARFLCAEPTDSKTQKLMQCIDERKRKSTPIPQQGSTTTTAA